MNTRHYWMWNAMHKKFCKRLKVDHTDKWYILNVVSQHFVWLQLPCPKLRVSYISVACRWSVRPTNRSVTDHINKLVSFCKAFFFYSSLSISWELRYLYFLCSKEKTHMFFSAVLAAHHYTRQKLFKKMRSTKFTCTYKQILLIRLKTRFIFL